MSQWIATRKRLLLCLVFVAAFIFLRWRYDSISDLALIASYILVIALLVHTIRDVIRLFRDSLVFRPDSPPHSRSCVASPDVFGLWFEEHFVHAKDGCKLHFYFVKGAKEYGAVQPETPPPPTILFFHGNSGNIGHRLPNVNLLVRVG